MSPTRYSLAAIFLHWVLALALAFQIGMGWQLEHLPRGPVMFAMFQLHKSIGIVILLLSAVRLGLRWTLPRPKPMRDDPLKMRLAAWVHTGLYIFMIGAPLSGWLLVSTAEIKVPTLLFGVMPWPDIPFTSSLPNAVHEASEAIHAWLAWLGIALFLMHVAGALRHELLLREATVERMLPAPLGSASRRFGGAIIALLALVTGITLLLGQSVRTGDGGNAVAQAEMAVAAIASAPENKPLPPKAEETEPGAPTNEIAAAEATPAAAKPLPWTVEGGGTLSFKADWNGNAIDGRFQRWSADIKFDPAALPQSSISVNVDLTSADTADSQRDSMLKGEDFFDATRMATARYQSTAITHVGGDRYEAQGKLTLKGVTKTVPLRFTLRIRDQKATVTGSASIDRTAFQVGTGQWSSTGEIGAQVAIAFNFTASAQ